MRASTGSCGAEAIVILGRELCVVHHHPLVVRDITAQATNTITHIHASAHINGLID